MIGGSCTGTENEATGFRVSKFVGAVAGTGGAAYGSYALLAAADTNLGLKILFGLMITGLGNQAGRGLGVAAYYGLKFFADKCSKRGYEEIPDANVSERSKNTVEIVVDKSASPQ